MPSKLGITLAGTFDSQFDPDALSFISAATITDTATRYGINDLVTGLKLNGLWTKMQAIYPFAGSTATTQKWNLKDPRDLDAAFRLVFSGGITHDSNGITPNGTNGYADTFYIPNTSGSQNDQHVSIYSRTNSATNVKDFGTQSGASNTILLGIRTVSPDFFGVSGVNSAADLALGLFPSSTGLFVLSRTVSASFKVFRDGVLAKTVSNVSAGRSTVKLLLGANNNNGTIGEYSARNYAFASVGTGLTDAEVLTLSSLVQRYQNALSRAIVAVPTVQDLDAQNFLVAAAVTDSTQAQAIQNLVAGLKFNSLWTKMQAIYPFVGSTATTQKWNLKSPYDADASFRLTFFGGWTHASTGAKSNGTNAYANTSYNANTVVQNDTSIGFYARLNIAISGNPIDIGYFNESTGFGFFLAAEIITNLPRLRMYQNAVDSTGTNQQGFWTGAAGADTRLIKNGTVLTTAANSGTFPLTSGNVVLAALNTQGGIGYYAEQEYAFAFIGSNLTNTEAANFYTVVQAYQTALSRQV